MVPTLPHPKHTLYIFSNAGTNCGTDFYLNYSNSGKGVRECRNINAILGNRNARCKLIVVKDVQ